MRRLDLSGNRLRDVSTLGDLPQLVWLRLAGNPISDFSPLGRLMAARWLTLDGRVSRGEAVPSRRTLSERRAAGHRPRGSL